MFLLREVSFFVLLACTARYTGMVQSTDHARSCSTNPYHHQHALGDKIVVRTGLLEGSQSWSNVPMEIYGKDKLSWQPQVAKDIAPAGPGS